MERRETSPRRYFWRERQGLDGTSLATELRLLRPDILWPTIRNPAWSPSSTLLRGFLHPEKPRSGRANDRPTDINRGHRPSSLSKEHKKNIVL